MDTDRNDRTDGPLEHDDRTDERERVVVVDDDRRVSEQRSDTAQLTETEIVRLRTVLNDGTLDNGASRFKWFFLGFVAALVALIVAAGAFLVVSDDDDDGQIDVEVPEVDVGG